ncbi:50S ribosomal protein L29 [Candidatus Daviesbacteria bacterium]|nr:50S ribosomal protein L29 [Candidatus Daviesbacteria bacterium]
MKTNDFKKLKNLTMEEIKQKAQEAKKELAKLVMDKNMKKLKDVKAVSKKKKELAQLLTLGRQKQLLSELEPEVGVKEVKKEIKGGKKS